MDCGHYEQLICRMPDEELSGQELKSLYEHLRACPECRRLHAAVRELSRELREEAEAPENLLPNVMAAVQAAGPHKRRKKSAWAGWVVTAACAALVIGVGAPLLSPRGSADLARSEAYVAPAAAEAAPAEAQALPEEAPLPEPAEEEAVEEAAFDSAVSYSAAAEEPAEAAPAGKAAPAAEAPEEELAAGTTGAAAWDGEANQESEPFATALPEAGPEDVPAYPVLDGQGELLGHIRDMDALFSLCSPEGEPLDRTEFVCDYNIEYNGLVYQFLVYDGRLWWRSDGESLLLPANGSEETLLYLIG